MTRCNIPNDDASAQWCDVCQCCVGRGPKQWAQHRAGIKHRRLQLGQRHFGNNQVAASVFEDATAVDSRHRHGANKRHKGARHHDRVEFSIEPTSAFRAGVRRLVAEVQGVHRLDEVVDRLLEPKAWRAAHTLAQAALSSTQFACSQPADGELPPSVASSSRSQDAGNDESTTSGAQAPSLDMLVASDCAQAVPGAGVVGGGALAQSRSDIRDMLPNNCSGTSSSRCCGRRQCPLPSHGFCVCTSRVISNTADDQQRHEPYQSCTMFKCILSVQNCQRLKQAT